MSTAPQHLHAPVSAETTALLVHLPPVLHLTDDQLYEFCQLNRELRIERTARGGLLIMSPAGGDTSEKNAGITAQLWIWARRDGTGTAFDSSGGFVLPNGAARSPDASWVDHTRLAALSAEQRVKLLPLCPDFVIERSSSTRSSPECRRLAIVRGYASDNRALLFRPRSRDGLRRCPAVPRQPCTTKIAQGLRPPGLHEVMKSRVKV